jgi:hypothetical protein
MAAATKTRAGIPDSRYIQYVNFDGTKEIALLCLISRAKWIKLKAMKVTNHGIVASGSSSNAIMAWFHYSLRWPQ